MKRLPLVAASALLIASFPFSTKARQVSVTYRFSEPRIETSQDGFSLLFFPSTIQAGKAGGPSFPFRGIRILLPPGEAASAISFNRRGWKDIDKEIILRPRQHPLPGIEAEGSESAFLYNETAYSSAEWIHPPSSGPRTHYYRGHPIVTGSFTPAGFLPSANRVGYYSEVEVIVETIPSEKSSEALSLLRSDAPTIKYLEGLIDNPSAEAFYDRISGPILPAGDEYEYLIITKAILENDFIPLKEFYTRRGMRSEIMTVEYIIGAFPGNDTQERIRNAIIEEYAASGITHVLLAGDGNPGAPATVPYRGLSCSVYSSSVYYDPDIPADIYYAALDGDWNTDSDDEWGEAGEEDLFSDISIGRAPVDSQEEAATFIYKTASYQESPVTGQSRNLLLLGEEMFSDPLTYGGDEMDQLVGTCTAYGFSTTGFPPDFNITKYYDRELEYWYKSDVYAEVNAGTNWICHAGHSNTNSVMRLSISDVNETNFTNDGITAKFPIVNTYGCYAGAFDLDCIAEKFLGINRFASAFVGNSRYGWFTEGSTNGPSHHFQREFFDAVFTEGYTDLGSANQRSKDETAAFVDLPDEYESGAHRWCFYCLNLLGDPAMDGWTDTPSQMVVAHNASIERSTVSFPVETEEEGSLGALYWNGICYGRGIAGPGGSLSLPLSVPVTDEVDSLIITVTAHNRQFYRDTLTVDSGDIPAVTALYQNYPNPFNPGTEICFFLKNSCRVDLRVYDAAGREVECLRCDDLDAGEHTVRWTPENLSSGVYFYRLKAGGKTISRKAVLLR
ncbi:MAG: T9SS type A sorting domain-containing protein [Candidatus Krumholzibacteriota bacterium]|nr:T9SS type A sorting domain-containing protein [Candidatus Krumholzibacteriota bacterium]